MPATPAAHEPERLQKVMAAAGVGSRRHCEELIRAGRVEVDRRVVRELGTKVDPAAQEIRLDGIVLARGKRVYYLVNKPVGVVSTNADPAGRPRVVDLLPEMPERLFTVGRLDLSSEGLMLVTNDGELANQLAHPRYGVEKTYHVLVAGTADFDVLGKLRQGIHLAEGVARVVSARVRTSFKHSTLLEIVLAEGRNREIRRLLAKVGHKVLRLKRVALGPVRLADLPPGHFRPLRNDELKLLRRLGRRPVRRNKPGAHRPQGDAQTPPAGPPDQPEQKQAPRPRQRGGHTARVDQGDPRAGRRGRRNAAKSSRRADQGRGR